MAPDGVDADPLNQDAKELVTLLYSCVVPLSRFVDDYIDAGCPPALERDLNRAVQTIQTLNEKIAEARPNVAEASQPSPDQHLNPPAQETDTPQTPEPAPQQTVQLRKRNSKMLSFLILFAVARRRSQGRTISQDAVFDLLCKFDQTQAPKRPSYTAKLAGFRRNKFLFWTDTEDLKIDEIGLAELVRLYTIVKEKGAEFEELRIILEDFADGRLEAMEFLAPKQA
ncbi:MAG: hypothetical protein ACRBB0_23150 [Pelagimonas sp.]|uniref:hypothetical protein n=1 Tax=Pelagimonas sp. TaxID=2073170 RepID=UPI003D6BEF47